MKIYCATFLHAKDQRQVLKEGKNTCRLYSYYYIRSVKDMLASFQELVKETES